MNDSTKNLPAQRMKAVETGLAMFQASQAEVERLEKELDKAKDKINELSIENDGLRQHNTQMDSIARTHQMERDQAVADRVSYETLFAAVQAQLRIFHIPSPMLAKTMDHPAPGLDAIRRSWDGKNEREKE